MVPHSMNRSACPTGRKLQSPRYRQRVLNRRSGCRLDANRLEGSAESFAGVEKPVDVLAVTIQLRNVPVGVLRDPAGASMRQLLEPQGSPVRILKRLALGQELPEELCVTICVLRIDVKLVPETPAGREAAADGSSAHWRRHR